MLMGLCYLEKGVLSYNPVISALLQTPVADHRVVYRCTLFKTCIGYAMFRLNRGQEGLIPLVGWLLAFVGKHVVLAKAQQCVRDELMNFLSRNMAQVEVFILQIKFPSLYLPGQCDVKVGQVHMVCLQDEVTIVE